VAEGVGVDVEGPAVKGAKEILEKDVGGTVTNSSRSSMSGKSSSLAEKRPDPGTFALAVKVAAPSCARFVLSA
jgi:hypothetical protein